MSYQYPPPPPPPNGNDLGISHSSYLNGYATPSTSSMEGANDQEQAHLALSNEKRRNKLGYHRTSVACGHCRRRKIRCILQPADPSGRCMNCIRLKKECSFFPVDQQPPTLPGPKSGVRPSVVPMPKIPSASSSPAMQTGRATGIPRQPSYPQLVTAPPPLPNMGPPSSMQHQATENYSVSPEITGGVATSRAYDFNPGVTGWMPADPGASAAAKGTDDVNGPWRGTYPHTSPVTPSFSPYAAHAAPPAAAWPSGPGGPGVVGEAAVSRPEDIGWTPYPAPPTRSASYGEEQHHEPYSPISQVAGTPLPRAYERRPSTTTSDTYPPHVIATSVPGAMPGTAAAAVGGAHTAASMSTGPGPAPGYGAWASAQPYGYGRPGDGYGWYNEGASGPHDAPGPEHMHHQAEALYYGGR